MVAAALTASMVSQASEIQMMMSGYWTIAIANPQLMDFEQQTLMQEDLLKRRQKPDSDTDRQRPWALLAPDSAMFLAIDCFHLDYTVVDAVCYTSSTDDEEVDDCRYDDDCC